MKRTMDDEPEIPAYPPAVVEALMRQEAVEVGKPIPFYGDELPDGLDDTACHVLAEQTVTQLGLGRWLWGPRVTRAAFGTWLAVGVYQQEPELNPPDDLSSLTG